MTEISRGFENGIDVTRVSQEGEPTLYVEVAFPHEAEGFSDFDTTKAPAQTVHLLEHVGCCGGEGTIDARSHRRNKALFAAVTNAFTGFGLPDSSIYYVGTFHATKTPPEVISEFVGETKPALRVEDIEQQRAIVGAELRSYLANRQRQLSVERAFEQGFLYGDDNGGLRRLPDITYDHMAEFAATAQTKENARVLIAGDMNLPETITMIEAVTDSLQQLGNSNRMTHSYQPYRNLPDWHKDLDNVSNSEFTLTMVSPTETDVANRGRDTAISNIVTGLLGSFPGEHANSFFWASRDLGLSYSPQVNLYRAPYEWCVGLSDSVEPDKVKTEVELLKDSLKVIRDEVSRSEKLFEDVRRWCLLQTEMGNTSAKGTASAFASELRFTDAIPFSIQDVIKAFHDLDHETFVSVYGEVVEGLLNGPNRFTNIYSSGTRPS